ncbi:hypothetical protein GCM10009715_40870 [Paeniglutamicibacter psychrophenolicus]
MPGSWEGCGEVLLVPPATGSVPVAPGSAGRNIEAMPNPAHNKSPATTSREMNTASRRRRKTRAEGRVERTCFCAMPQGYETNRFDPDSHAAS